MLYLFGRLALSDSLSYHEELWDDSSQRQAFHRHLMSTRPDARTAAISRRLRRNRHFPQSSRAVRYRSS